MTRGFAIEEVEFLLQRRVPMSRQGLDEVFNHGPQAARNLHIAGTTGADFGKGEMGEGASSGAVDVAHKQAACAAPRYSVAIESMAKRYFSYVRK